MIKYETGNLLDSEAYALVNAVNCQGVMGKGIAYQFKQKFPNNFKFYSESCKKGEVKVGNVLTFKEKGKVIINFPTKDSWRKKSEYDYIVNGLSSLRALIEKEDIHSIALPPLGCGNGGLKWEVVNKLIQDAFDDLESVDVLVFAPVTTNTESKHKKLLNIDLLLLQFAFKKLTEKKKYSYFTLFYLSDCLTRRNHYEFTFEHQRAYSLKLENLINELRSIKVKYQDDFENIVEDYLNTHLDKDLQLEFNKLSPSINAGINFLNELGSKDEFTLATSIFRDLNSKPIDEGAICNESSEYRKIIELLFKHNLIKKNVFNQIEIDHY